MILSALAALSLLRTLENVNELSPVIAQAGPVGKEIVAVKKLQDLVGKEMWSDHARGASTMLRWLRAKKMNVPEAEKMIRAHLKWRKDLEIDKMRNLPAEPKMLERFWYNMTGFARNENPVMLMPFGSWDIRGFIDGGGTREHFDKYQGQMWEKALAAVEYVELKQKKPRKDNSPVTYIMICDMGGLQYRQLASVTSAQFILSMVFNFENNYPEVIMHAHLINSDWVVEMLLRIIRPFMAGSIEKLKVYGDREKWEKPLRRLIDPAILTYRYGGYTIKEREKLGLPPLPTCKYC